MYNTDKKWLRKLGVTTSDKATLDKLINKATSELEWRVGNKISQKLTSKQLDEFDAIEDEDKRLTWLEKAYPTYKEVVAAEYDKLSRQIKEATDKVKLISSWQH